MFKKKRKRIYNTARRGMAAILLFTMLFTMFLPVGLAQPKQAHAETVYVDGIGKVKILYNGGRQYRVGLDGKNNLIIQGGYYHNSSALLSYHTTNLYFTTEKTYGDPTSVGAGKYVDVDVSRHKASQTPEADGLVWDTYTVSNEKLQSMIITLFGKEGLYQKQTIFMSEGFKLKKRASASAAWGAPYGNVYNTLTGIQNAATWSTETYQNFVLYYDIPLDLELIAYSIIVNADPEEGGYISQSVGEAHPGERVTVQAALEKGWEFDKWTVEAGGMVLSTITGLQTTFTMPTTDVVLTAHFKEKPKPPEVRPPDASPTPIPEVTATPEPTPTSAPYIPDESSDIQKKHIRYFTTDAGYTIESIYNGSAKISDSAAGYLADVGGVTGAGRILDSRHTSLDKYYTVGTDSFGNKWYFLPNGTMANYVHPYIYSGYNANTAEVKYITELVFPNTITYKETTYTVNSIGGGTGKYKTEDSFSAGGNGAATSYNYNITTNHSANSNWNDYFDIASNYVNNLSSNNSLDSIYGVIGNGAFTSSGYLHQDWWQSSIHTFHYLEYENSYHVYNTTLKSITIPSTVTTIEEYAFYNCQALTEIKGAEGVTSIGEHAFSSAEHMSPQTSLEQNDYKIYYYYNDSYSLTTPTTTMSQWKNSVKLSTFLSLPEFCSLCVIRDFAFARRTNLYDVVLPNSVYSIWSYAFSGCNLESIKILNASTVIYDNKDTLGTKGGQNTTIITVPNSTAMDYGIKYSDYYKLRCGYEVVYHNNLSPEETYISRADLTINTADIIKKEEVYSDISYTNGGVYFSARNTIYLDTNGKLWIRQTNSGTLLTPLLASKTFKPEFLLTFYGTGKNSVGEDTSEQWIIAIADDGTAFMIAPNGALTDLGIPTGSTGHLFGDMTIYNSISDSFLSGYSRGNNLTTKTYLYYLYNGVVYRRSLHYTEIYYSEYSYSSGSSGTNGGSEHGLLLNASPQQISPNGTVVTSFYVDDSSHSSFRKSLYSGDNSSSSDKSYEITLPTAFLMTSDGRCMVGKKTVKEKYYYSRYYEDETETTSNGYDDNVFNKGDATLVNYDWRQYSGSFRQIIHSSKQEEGSTQYYYSDISSGSASRLASGTYDNIIVIDANGNLVYIQDINNDSSGYLGSGTSTTICSGKNFISAKWVENYILLTDVNGGVWKYDESTGSIMSFVISSPAIIETINATIVYETTLYANMFAGFGQEFTGWNTNANSGGASYAPGTVISVTEPLHLYAQWKKGTNVVRYAPNGGTGEMPEDVYDASVTAVTLKKNTFTKKGHEFAGWNTKRDGSGTFYADGATITIPYGTTTLYAQWSPFSYTVQIAEDDIRVTPMQITSSVTLSHGQSMTIPGAKADKQMVISYELNKRPGMSTTPAWKTPPTTAEYTTAYLQFISWRLYEKTAEGYNYLGFYEPGMVVKDLAVRNNSVLVLAPYWGGTASLVKLPTAECTGYEFVGFTSGAAKDINVYVTAEQIENAVASGELTVAPEGSGAQYQPKKNGEVLYAYYNTKRYGIKEIELDGRGATKQEQTAVTVTYGETVSHVVPPEKTGYDFGGYYTGINGGGTKYYDREGKGLAAWTEDTAQVLYADWIQRKVEFPKEEEWEPPTADPAETITIEAKRSDASVKIYADDNNTLTDARTDVPPYVVSDIWSGDYLVAEGAIPSTEKVAMCAQTGAWLLSCSLTRKCGIDMVRVHVTVPYRTQYENAENESLVISNRQTKSIEVMVPKKWSYWVLEEGGMYFPEKVIVKNDSFAGKSEEVSVDWQVDDAVKKPEYYLTAYGEKDKHLQFDSYDEDGVPSVYITLEEEQYIISEIPGQLPDVTTYLTTIASNAARMDKTQFSVKSDYLSVAGVTLLSDKKSVTNGMEPDAESIKKLEEKIEKTTDLQCYKAEIPLLETIQNGRYGSEAEVLYRADTGNVGIKKHISINVAEVNEIKIHTPVVCLPKLTADHEDRYQGEELPKDSTLLLLDENGKHSDFTVLIGNTGYHSDRQGYQEQNYTRFLNEKEGIKQNEVCFPFDVWLDVDNDEKKDNDVWLNAGTWYMIGTAEQRFYVPVWTKEGDYEILFRSVAVNGVGRENCVEWERNLEASNCVAEKKLKVYVAGGIYDFFVYDVGGTAAWDEVIENTFYTIGVRPPVFSYWETLPLRSGVHPLYRNLGGLPMGGRFSFQVKSTGSLYDSESILQVEPNFVLVNGESYQEADIYYEEVTATGVCLKKWDSDEHKIVLHGDEQNDFVRTWSGGFTVPERLYIARKGSDVFGYQKRCGLSFTEEFWIKDKPLMLRFGLQLENMRGENMFYGMLPDGREDTIWQTEAVTLFREDNDKNIYKIQGGEIAVIYPGNYAGEEFKLNGIY